MAGQFDDSFTINYALSLTQSGLNNELIQRRTDKIGCILESVLHSLRHPGRNSAPIVRSKCHVFWLVVSVSFSRQSGMPFRGMPL